MIKASLVDWPKAGIMTAMAVERHPAVKKILVVRLGHMGDVVMVTPCLRAIRKKYPASEIYFLVRAEHVAIVRNNPHVTQIIEAPPFKKHGVEIYREYLEATCGLDFDLAIDLHGTASSAQWVYASEAKVKAGLAIFPRRGWDSVVWWKPEEHFIETFARVLKCLDIPVEDLSPEIYLDPSNRTQEQVRKRLRTYGVEPGKFILLNPFSTYQSKCWPMHLCAKWMREAEKIFNLPIVVVGGPNERKESEALTLLSGLEKCCNLTGEIRLDEALALYSMGLLMVTGDSGPMHAAAAIGTPVISLFGPTHPERTGPWHFQHLVVKSDRPPTHFEYFKKGSEAYMERIPTESVLALAKTHLEKPHYANGRSQTAVILTAQDVSESHLKLVQDQIKELRKQEGRPLIALGVLNSSEKWMPLISNVDQVTVVDGDPLLIQREAIRNQVVRKLPSHIRKLIFLDPTLSPQTRDWASKTESLLEKCDFVLPFSEIPNTVSALYYLGPFKDPDNRWDDEIPTDGALAMTRDLWEKYQGLPFLDGITGRNSVRHFFQYEYCRRFSVPHCFKSEIYLADSQTLKIRLRFTPRKLKWLKPPHGYGQMRDLYIWALKNRLHLEKHIHMNSAGGLELSAEGEFLRSDLRRLRSAPLEVKNQNLLSVREIKIKELVSFTQAYLEECSGVDLIPISLEEAQRRQTESGLDGNEIGLVLGYLGDRCVAYVQVVPMTARKGDSLQKSYSVHSGFVYHHLKPSGIVRKMFERLSVDQKESIFCSDGTVEVGRYLRGATGSARPELAPLHHAE